MKKASETLYLSNDDYVACAKLQNGRSVYLSKDGVNIVCESFDDAKKHVKDYERLMKQFWEIFK